jgi:hypothetical protein
MIPINVERALLLTFSFFRDLPEPLRGHFHSSAQHVSVSRGTALFEDGALAANSLCC